MGEAILVWYLLLLKISMIVIASKYSYPWWPTAAFLTGDTSSSSNNDAQFEAGVQLLKSNTDYKKPIVQMEVKEIGAKQFILVVLCEGGVSVHYISQVRWSLTSYASGTNSVTKFTTTYYKNLFIHRGLNLTNNQCNQMARISGHLQPWKIAQ